MYSAYQTLVIDSLFSHIVIRTFFVYPSDRQLVVDRCCKYDNSYVPIQLEREGDLDVTVPQIFVSSSIFRMEANSLVQFNNEFQILPFLHVERCVFSPNDTTIDIIGDYSSLPGVMVDVTNLLGNSGTFRINSSLTSTLNHWGNQGLTIL